MRTLTSILALAGLLTLNACSGTDSDKDATTDETGEETTAEPLPLQIETVNSTCAGDAYTVTAETQEWAQTATAFILQTIPDDPNTAYQDNWDETHELAAAGTTEDPNTSSWAVTTVKVAKPEDVKDGSSLFGCDLDDTLTFAVKIYDTTGAEVDCAVWGDEPDSVIAGDYVANDLSPTTVDAEDFSGCIKF